MSIPIVGDFNSIFTAKALTLVRERGHIDSFVAVHDDPNTHSTWRWRTRNGDAGLRIDDLFHTLHFRTVESRILEVTGSDHYLLVSQIKPR